MPPFALMHHTYPTRQYIDNLTGKTTFTETSYRIFSMHCTDVRIIRRYTVVFLVKIDYSNISGSIKLRHCEYLIYHYQFPSGIWYARIKHQAIRLTPRYFSYYASQFIQNIFMSQQQPEKNRLISYHRCHLVWLGI